MLRAGVLLAVDAVLLLRRRVGQVDEQDPLREPQHGLDRVGHPAGVRPRVAFVIGLAHGDAVDDDVDRVLVLLVELDVLVEVAQLPVDPDAHEARLLRAGEELLVLALAILDERRHEHDPRPLRKRVDLVDHLLDGLALDLAAADRAMHATDAGEEEPQVVVDLGDGADRRSRVLATRPSGRC